MVIIVTKVVSSSRDREERRDKKDKREDHLRKERDHLRKERDYLRTTWE